MLTRRLLSLLPVLAAPLAAQKPDKVAVAVKEWERVKLGMTEYIDAMPEGGLAFKPTPEVRTFAEQMVHVANTQYMFAAAVSGQPNPYDPKKGDVEKREDLRATKAALRKFVLESYDFMIGAVRALSVAQLDQDVDWFGGKMPRYLLLNKAVEHHAHHRGQTTAYLRLKGITPPSERLF